MTPRPPSLKNLGARLPLPGGAVVGLREDTERLRELRELRVSVVNEEILGELGVWAVDARENTERLRELRVSVVNTENPVALAPFKEPC